MCLRVPVLAALAAGTLAGATGASASSLDDALTSARGASGATGVAAAVVRDGRLVWEGRSGLAVRRPRRAVDGRTLFSLASVTKPYVATLVLRMAEHGRLRLDDPIARHLPFAVPGASRVSVRQLLDHTSGYTEVYDRQPFAAWFDEAYDPDRRWRLAQLLRAVRAPRTTPGRRFAYANVNYLLAGAVAAHVARAPLARALRREVLAPLGLDHTSLLRRPGPAARFAHGFDADGDTFAGARGVPTDLWGPTWPDGGLAATAPDAARFGDGLLGGRLLRPASLAAMQRPSRASRSAEDPYGLGLYETRMAGRTWTGHDGSWTGFTAELWREPRSRTTLAVLVNDDRRDPAAAIARRLAPVAQRVR